MPIKSYIAFPCEGKEQEFEDYFNQLPEVDLVKSDEKEVYILVTDTKTDEEDKIIQKKLEDMSSIKCLTMVSAFDDNIEQ